MVAAGAARLRRVAAAAAGLDARLRRRARTLHQRTRWRCRAAGFVGDGFACPGEDVVDELAVGGRELVPAVLFWEVEPAGERGVGVQVGADEVAAALDEVAGELGTGPLIDLLIIGKPGQRRVQEPDQGPEGSLVSGMGGGGDEDELPAGACGEVFEEVVPLVGGSPAAGISGAGVGLVNDDQVGGASDELVPAALSLDVVGRDDCVGEHFEHALAERA